jgi:hypothetical protein
LGCGGFFVDVCFFFCCFLITKYENVTITENLQAHSLHCLTFLLTYICKIYVRYISCSACYTQFIFEPRHDKTNIVRLRPAWIQTSLRIPAVWSGSMLFAISFFTCYMVCKRTAWILIRLCGCAGWSESMLVANALCWICRDLAHFNVNCEKKEDKLAQPDTTS